MLATGLAQSAVHPDDAKELIPLSLFQNDSSDSAISRLTALLPSLALNKASGTNEHTGANGKTNTGVHAFTILARVLADDKFAPAAVGLPVPEGESQFGRVNGAQGDALAQLAAQWAAELQGPGATADAIAKKIEELAWMNTLIYGVGGWTGRENSPTKEFNADFF